MRYIQPYGMVDPDAPYINGDPSIARQGSIPPAEAFEHPMRELVSIIDYNMLTPTDADLEQVFKSVRSQRMNYAQDTGSVNTLSVAFDSPIAAYSLGLPIRVKVANTNTGPCTIDAGGGRVSIKKPTGAELAADDIRAGGLIELVYDGASFQMINFGGAGAGGAANTYMVNIPYTVDTSPTANTITANFSPAITTLVPGTIIMVKAANTNTGLTTIKVNAIAAKSIYALGGAPEIPLLPSDIVVGDIMILTYDGTRFWLAPNAIINVDSTFNVANNTDIDTIFRALARKRIQPAVTITIKLATGIYTPFTTYHSDAQRIVVEGTMLAANPTVASFARTGASGAARANDAANNIVMLRSRYGTEVRITLATQNQGGVAVSHYGPGSITFKNLLITGPNTTGNGFGALIAGPNFTITGCSFWGSSWSSVYTIASSNVNMVNSFVCASYADGVAANTGASIWCTNCGVFGGGSDGFTAGMNGSVFLYQAGNYSQCNSNSGCYARQGGTIWVGGGAITSNGYIDFIGWGNATMITVSGAVVGTASPVQNSEGNYGAIHV